MVAGTIRTLVLIIAVPAGAIAADGQRTALGCAFGSGEGTDRQIEVRNSTGQPLKAGTVVNYNMYWKKAAMQGEGAGCFAIPRDLAANLQVARKIQLSPGAEPQRCVAYISPKYPSVIRGTDGSTEVRCDP
jgi:hypothetical protein